MLTLRCCKTLYIQRNLADDDTATYQYPQHQQGFLQITTHQYFSPNNTLLRKHIFYHYLYLPFSKRRVSVIFSHSTSTASSVLWGLAVKYWNSLILIGKREGLNHSFQRKLPLVGQSWFTERWLSHSVKPDVQQNGGFNSNYVSKKSQRFKSNIQLRSSCLLEYYRLKNVTQKFLQQAYQRNAGC